MKVRLLRENKPRYSEAVKMARSRKRLTVHNFCVALQTEFNIGYGTAMNIVDVMKMYGDWPKR